MKKTLSLFMCLIMILALPFFKVKADKEEALKRANSIATLFTLIMIPYKTIDEIIVSPQSIDESDNETTIKYSVTPWLEDPITLDVTFERVRTIAQLSFASSSEEVNTNYTKALVFSLSNSFDDFNLVDELKDTKLKYKSNLMLYATHGFLITIQYEILKTGKNEFCHTIRVIR